MASNFCTNCGKPLEVGQRFCTACGTMADEDPSIQPTTVIGDSARAQAAAPTTVLGGQQQPQEDAFGAADPFAPPPPGPRVEPTRAMPQVGQQQTTYNANPPAAEPPAKGGKKTGLIIGIVIAAVVVIALAALLALTMCRGAGGELELKVVEVDSAGFPNEVEAYVLVTDENGDAVEDLHRSDFYVYESESGGDDFDADITRVDELSDSEIGQLEDLSSTSGSVLCITYSVDYGDKEARRTVHVEMSDESGYEGSAKKSYVPSSQRAAADEPAEQPTTSSAADQAEVALSAVSDNSTGNRSLSGRVYRQGADSSGAMCVLPESSTYRVSDEELASLSDEQLCIARNEIYARHGYKFKNAGLSDYFQTYFKGYRGTVTDQGAIALNDVERANTEAILALEESRNSIWTHLKTD